jgi:hypothetical protein
MIPSKATEAQSREHAKSAAGGAKPISGAPSLADTKGELGGSGPTRPGPNLKGVGPSEDYGTASKGELQKAKKALPPQLVDSMLSDISKIDPKKSLQTGTLGKVGHLTAHVVDPTTLGIHHGMTQPPDLSQGATNDHPDTGDIVPKGQLYIAHGTHGPDLANHLLGRTVESHLMNRGWKHDAAKRVSKHLQTPPQPQQQPQQQPQPQPNMPQPGAMPQGQPGMQGLPPWLLGMSGQGGP